MFVICIDTAGYEASLEARKVYRALEDETLSGRGLIRVVDESGEDYIFPASSFVEIEVPPEAEPAFAATA